MKSEWQIANGLKCGCAGADDYCGCQNDEDHFNPVAKAAARLDRGIARAKEELVRQAQESRNLAPYIGDVSEDDDLLIDGTVDLRLLVAAIMTGV